MDAPIKTIHVQTVAPAGATQIGGAIPADRIRKILGVTFANANGASEQITFFLGEVGTLTSTTVAIIDVQDASVAVNPQVLGKFDRNKPLWVLRPAKAAGGVVSQNLFGVQDTAARVEVTVTYVDEIE